MTAAERIKAYNEGKEVDHITVYQSFSSQNAPYSREVYKKTCDCF